jgi:hypothetical protein
VLFERLENPTSIKVTAGTEVIVNVELSERATASPKWTHFPSVRTLHARGVLRDEHSAAA